ncbi:MAG: hypothetical protein HYT79_03310 [Elusimicrobia bacterium]|nr:hypothetical protein [Elusimicrobiota bacterium]
MENKRETLLIGTSDRSLQRELAGAFRNSELIFTDTVEETELALLEKNIDVLIYDLKAILDFSLAAYGVIKKMRPRLPVIAITSAEAPQQDRKILEMGIFYLLHRPFAMDTLKQLVISAVEKSKKGEVLP